MTTILYFFWTGFSGVATAITSGPCYKPASTESADAFHLSTETADAFRLSTQTKDSFPGNNNECQ